MLSLNQVISEQVNYRKNRYESQERRDYAEDEINERLETAGQRIEELSEQEWLHMIEDIFESNPTPEENTYWELGYIHGYKRALEGTQNMLEKEIVDDIIQDETKHEICQKLQKLLNN